MHPTSDYRDFESVAATGWNAQEIARPKPSRDREEPYFDALGHVAAVEITGGSG